MWGHLTGGGGDLCINQTVHHKEFFPAVLVLNHSITYNEGLLSN